MSAQIKPAARRRAFTTSLPKTKKSLSKTRENNDIYSEEEKRIALIESRLKSLGADTDNNFALHTDNKLNTISNGKVAVNLCQSDGEPSIYVDDNIADKLDPHQIGGIRFLYDNIIGSIAGFDADGGFGCILAHSMGTGKTLQVIAFVDIFLRFTPAKSVIIVLPINALKNWIEELGKWKLLHPIVYKSLDGLTGKACKNRIAEWKKTGGILLVGYEKYLAITSIAEHFETHYKEVLEALRDPGPDLLILDEGHRIKNRATKTCRTLKKIRTKRRIILSGYPFQNNMMEYYSMIDFVRPGYLGWPKQFEDNFGGPIADGQCADASEFQKAEMKKQTHVLNKILRGVIQRVTEKVLIDVLPEKSDVVLMCRLTDFQIELMLEFLDHTLRAAKVTKRGKIKISFIKTFGICSKICNHPDIIHRILNDDNPEDQSESEFESEKLYYEWAKPFFSRYKPNDIQNSSKMAVLFAIINAAEDLNEKIVVFSQWLSSLDLIEHFLWVMKGWKRNRNYFRLDGQTKTLDRKSMIDKFKEDKDIRLFLISTKAGGEAVSLTAANRAVIFDASWNPSWDSQAAARIFRKGQEKKSFVYRLISDNSMEKRVLNKQVYKRTMLFNVVDRENAETELHRKELVVIVRELIRELDYIATNGLKLKPNKLKQSKQVIEKDPMFRSKHSTGLSSLLTQEPYYLDDWITVNPMPALTGHQKVVAEEEWKEMRF